MVSIIISIARCQNTLDDDLHAPLSTDASPVTHMPLTSSLYLFLSQSCSCPLFFYFHTFQHIYLNTTLLYYFGIHHSLPSTCNLYISCKHIWFTHRYCCVSLDCLAEQSCADAKASKREPVETITLPFFISILYLPTYFSYCKKGDLIIKYRGI